MQNIKGKQRLVRKKMNKKKVGWIFVFVIAVMVGLGAYKMVVYANLETRQTMDAENKIAEENKVIGMANGKEEIGAWEYRYFAELYKEEHAQKELNDPNPKVFENVKRYKSQLIKAKEDHMALSDVETAEIKTYMNENEARLKNKVDGNLFWSEALFHSIGKEHFMQIQVNLKKIENDMKELKNQMSVSDQELLQEYSQEKEGFVISDRAKVIKIAFMQEESHPDKVPAKAQQCYDKVLKGEGIKDLISQCSLSDAEKENSGEDILMKGLQDFDKGDKLFNLRPGETSEIIRNQNFYYIFQMEEMIPQTYRPYDDPNVQPVLTEKVKDSKYRQRVDEWLRKTSFTIYLREY